MTKLMQGADTQGDYYKGDEVNKTGYQTKLAKHFWLKYPHATAKEYRAFLESIGWKA